MYRGQGRKVTIGSRANRLTEVRSFGASTAKFTYDAAGRLAGSSYFDLPGDATVLDAPKRAATTTDARGWRTRGSLDGDSTRRVQRFATGAAAPAASPAPKAARGDPRGPGAATERCRARPGAPTCRSEPVLRCRSAARTGAGPGASTCRPEPVLRRRGLSLIQISEPTRPY